VGYSNAGHVSDAGPDAPYQENMPLKPWSLIQRLLRPIPFWQHNISMMIGISLQLKKR
jgi:hypothetical protein